MLLRDYGVLGVRRPWLLVSMGYRAAGLAREGKRGGVPHMSSQPPPPNTRDISAGTMKIPDPIIVPITIITESKSPSSRMKPALCSATLVEEELSINWLRCANHRL